MTSATVVPQQMRMTFRGEEQARWAAVETRDRGQDGVFYYAVKSTGVYCRPSCPSRRPRREQVEFYPTAEEAEAAGFRPCRRCHPRSQDGRAQLVHEVSRYIERHCDEPITLERLARHSGVSAFHLQRTFKASLGITPWEYADTCRLRALKSRLKSDDSVTTAMHGAGYGSSSRLYERTGPQLGMTPSHYRRGGDGVTIRYSIVDSPIGRMLVAATEKGVCSIAFAESDPKLVESLRREYPNAELKRRDVVLRRWIGAVLQQMYGKPQGHELPLDVRATAFQRRVWEHLQRIPYGDTESYGEVARAIGRPGAARAVARACASNPVAFAIPCHRVVPGGGGTGGYRWGAERKRKLLEIETRAAEARPPRGKA